MIAVHSTWSHPDSLHAYVGVLNQSTQKIDGFKEHFVTTDNGTILATSVSINDKNQAVAYYTWEAFELAACSCVPGTVDVSDSRFSAGESRLLENGAYGSIALDNNGMFVEVHQSNLIPEWHFSTAKLSADSKSIIDHSYSRIGDTSDATVNLWCSMSPTPDWVVVTYVPYNDGQPTCPYTMMGDVAVST